MRSRHRKALLLSIFFATAITVGAGAYTFSAEAKVAMDRVAMVSREKAGKLLIATGLTSCRIKGNISYNTGERIYHVPGQEDYYRTRISYLDGERWFCTEAEAQIAGWRKARN